ncbi:ABC transporter permease [Galbibacter sp. EGI 63066]|uniref:ABC transporter permease n=1 Tax=Galbibacter sp. EGI 63066 TaxID=2993559 RepID=UPI00224892BF|nr:ABC transporter permease [Galbibacter sp. EGI 63066]MCX2681743.1 ABC transporter permease [Galbibacter sp. EGI 63066]
MIKNYIKIAWRNLQKSKLQTIINLLGLTVGTVCCLSILVYVMAQLGYDSHHKDAESLYRVRTENKSIGNNSINSNFATAGPPFAFALKEDFPEVIEACRIVYFGSDTGKVIRKSNSDQSYYEPRGYLADSTVFNVFTYRFIEGNAKNALNAPNTVVLSSTLSKKLFGNQSALNKTLVQGSGEDEFTLTITGVFDDTYGRSHLNPNYFVSMNTPGQGEFVRSVQNFATQNFTHTYIKLAPGSDAGGLQKKLPAFLQNHGAKDLAAAGFDKKLFLQKVTDIHLYSDGITMQIDRVSSIKQLYILVILALFIQLVACINFINLSTARASKRAMEIGVRKAIGADKSVLIRQFIGESIMLSLLASLISLPVTALLQPFINTLIQGNVSFLALLDWKVLLLLLSLGIFTGLLAGIYPAWVLSSVKPARVLKGSVNQQTGNGNFRKGLVVFQFVVSIVLIISVIIITQQLKYTQDKDMGFDKENLIAIRLGTENAANKFETLKKQVSTVSGVSQVAGSNRYPSEFNKSDLSMHLPGKDPTNLTSVIYNGISKNYFKTVGTSLLAGRELRSNDSSQVVVNKATLDAFSIALDNAIGTKLINTYEGESTELEIVGVSQDYHFASLKEAIKPILLYNDATPSWLLVKAKTTDYNRLLKDLKQSWGSTITNTPFEYTFVDKEVEKLYTEEKRLANISIVLSFLAILISCLGLFGLVSFIAENKKKEIGIRKVLGAKIGTLVKLLVKDFVILVIIALIVATPLAYYFMQNWLEDFTYRISISWWIFLLAGGISLVIALLTVGIQTIKAATTNPIKNLRTE